MLDLALNGIYALAVVTSTAGAGDLVTLATAKSLGLSGFALRLQAFALSGAAKNGAFAATAARDLIL